MQRQQDSQRALDAIDHNSEGPPSSSYRQEHWYALDKGPFRARRDNPKRRDPEQLSTTPRNAQDLEKKLNGFAGYYNAARVHHSLNGATPQAKSGDSHRNVARLDNYR
jgi:hypothetical protein